MNPKAMIARLRAEKEAALSNPQSCENNYDCEEDSPYPCKPTCECALRDFILEHMEDATALIETLAPMLDDEPALEEQIAGRKKLAEWRDKCG